MKLSAKITSVSLFLACSTVGAEQSDQCLKYWNSPEVEIKILDKVDCPNIWEDKGDDISANKIVVLKAMGLSHKKMNWMSTGECQKLEHNKKFYYVYNAYQKEELNDIWMIYNKENLFMYFRKINFNEKNLEGRFKVNLNCNQVGSDKNIYNILNSYLKKDTDVKINLYKINDWYKEQ